MLDNVHFQTSRNARFTRGRLSGLFRETVM
jgi:hypothetical protein